MRWLRLILPMIGPFVVHFLYQPINERWTVERFGCGCPLVNVVDGSAFNANHFNAIFWVTVFFTCCCSLVAATRSHTSPWLELLRALGIALLAVFCLFLYGRGFWL